MRKPLDVLLHRLRLLFILLLAFGGALGCGVVAAALPIIADVIVAIQDAEQILDAIDEAADVYIERAGDPEVATKYRTAMSAARRSLNVALRTAHGTEHLTQEQVDLAFAEFRAAYAELQTVMKEIGMLTEAGALKVAPGAPPVNVPPPMALTLKVRES